MKGKGSKQKSLKLIVEYISFKIILRSQNHQSMQLSMRKTFKMNLMDYRFPSLMMDPFFKESITMDISVV